MKEHSMFGLSDRDFVGYARNVPVMQWPDGSQIAVSFVINIEEGSEQSVTDGDPAGESLGEVARSPAPGERDLAMETTYEYGGRAGLWRVLKLFDRYGMSVSLYACSVAVERNPDLADYLSGPISHEIVCHGYRWEDVTQLGVEQEREHIRLAIESLQKTTGKTPTGWYCRYAPSIHTRRLLIEHGGFEYDCDSYADDLPFTVNVDGREWCVVPHAFDTNDIKFWRGGLSTSNDFFEYLKDSFDVLYREGETHPKMMTISLHTRIIGRPGRFAALEKFVDYIRTKEKVWVSTRGQIASAYRQSAGQERA